MCLYHFPFRFVTCRGIESYRSFYNIVQAEIADQAVQVTSLQAEVFCSSRVIALSMGNGSTDELLLCISDRGMELARWSAC